MSTPTHLLIHHYTPGTGPQEGTPELESEMAIWAEIDTELRRSGQLIEGWALHPAHLQLGQTDEDSGTQVTFAVHALAADDDGAAQAIAQRMPHLSYGSTTIHRLMR